MGVGGLGDVDLSPFFPIVGNCFKSPFRDLIWGMWPGTCVSSVPVDGPNGQVGKPLGVREAQHSPRLRRLSIHFDLDPLKIRLKRIEIARKEEHVLLERWGFKIHES